MNYIFCDKKCYEELKEIDTLLDTKCSDIDKAIAKLKEKRNCGSNISTGEYVGSVIGVVITAVIAYALKHVNVALGVGSIFLLGPIWVTMCGLMGEKIDKTGVYKRTKREAIDQALENLREFKEKFKQIRDKIRLSELLEIEQLSRYIRECKNTYVQVFLNVAERDSKTVLVTVTAKAETKRSKDGTAEFHTLGREKVFTIVKDFCAKIFPDPDTCDFSWLNNTSKQCLCSVERISEKIDGFKDVDPVGIPKFEFEDSISYNNICDKNAI